MNIYSLPSFSWCIYSIIFHKNVINVDVARSLKFLISCNILCTCWYDIRIDDICLIYRYTTTNSLNTYIYGAVISSLHRVATASVNSYTSNIAQVNPFMKVVLRRQKIWFSFVLVQIWFGLPFLFENEFLIHSSPSLQKDVLSWYVFK